MFSAFFLVYASDMKVGRFVPSKIDPELFQERRSVDGPALLQRLSDYKDLQRFFAEWEPQHPAYKALRSVLVRYREIEGAGGWPKIDPGEVLKPGMQDPRILQIRKRLHASYDMRATTTATDVYDDNLVQAMRGFQKRHGLDPDGVIGKNTLIALNVSTADRVRQIIANMERWRWMPEKMGADHIMVNIAGFELIRVRGGKVVRHMPVVVGKTYHRTPVFSDRIRYLEFNPTWTVPYSIATKEFLPKLKQDPEAYAARDFDLLQSGNSVSWYGIDWQQYSTRKFPYTIRQNPGPKNALGRVKFMFPNKHNVYLHDTPARSLFAQVLPGAEPWLRPARRAGQVRRRGAGRPARLVAGTDQFGSDLGGDHQGQPEEADPGPPGLRHRLARRRRHGAFPPGHLWPGRAAVPRVVRQAHAIAMSSFPRKWESSFYLDGINRTTGVTGFPPSRE